MKALIERRPVFIVRTYEDGDGWGDPYTNAVALSCYAPYEVVAMTRPPTVTEWLAFNALLKTLDISEYIFVRYKDGQKIEKKMKVK